MVLPTKKPPVWKSLRDTISRMVRYVAMISVIMCGFTAGLFVAYQLEPTVAYAPMSDDTSPFFPHAERGQHTYGLGTIVEMDSARGLLGVEAHDPTNASKPRRLLVTIGPATSIATFDGQPLGVGDFINMQLLLGAVEIRATSITQAVLPL